MTQIQAMPSGRSQAPSPTSLKVSRLFYSATAALMLALAFAGFSRFFLQGMAYPGREIAPPIRTLVIVHGSVMTAWLVLLLVQPLLIVRGSRRVHMTLGKVGAALAGLILVLGVWVAIGSTSVTPPEARIWGLPPRQFMVVPFFSALVFAAFVGVGLYFRRRPAIHRPMMMLATLSAIPAAVSRIDLLNNLYIGTVWERVFGPFFATVVLGVVLLGIRSVLMRSLDRWFAVGLGSLTVAWALIMQVAPTVAWEWFTTAVVP